MKTLVTGVAGFIGMHVAERLLARGDEVVGVDDLNAYYDPALKRARLARLQSMSGLRFSQMSIEDMPAVNALFENEVPDRVLHLAAQPGVRQSIQQPHVTTGVNLQGFMNVLEGCRRKEVGHLLFASSSSVYGSNGLLPFAECDSVDHPISLYAATKRANELMAHSYSHMFRVPVTGARLFTVYGPWGRPDMAMWRFTRAIIQGEPINLYDEGRALRDFTYVDDVADVLVRLLDKPATAACNSSVSGHDPSQSDAPYRIFNVGGARPVSVLQMVQALESALARTAKRRLMPMQPGDVPATAADSSRLQAWIGGAPETPLAEGVRRFVDWYCSFYGIEGRARCLNEADQAA